MRAFLITLLWVLGLLSHAVSGSLDLHAGSHERSSLRVRHDPATNVVIIPKEIQKDADAHVKEHTDTKDPLNKVANHIDTHVDNTHEHVSGNVDDATVKMAEDEPAKEYTNRARLLTDHDLHGLESIECLEKMQRGESDPKCAGHKKEKKEESVPEVYDKRHTWWVSHYPHYKSEQCHGHGMHFCDPDDLLNETERCKVAEELDRFARNHDVMCDVPGTGNQEKYPFFLGVALVRKMPDLLLDQSSMNHFGEGVLAEWGLLEDRTCPNSAVIVISAETNQASLASSSCEFVCEERGGRGVNVRVRELLTLTGSPFKAALGGIQEFGSVFRNESPLYETAGVGLPSTKAVLSKDLTDKIDSAGLAMEEVTGGYEVHEAPAPDSDRKDLPTYLAHREGSYALVQRGVFGLILLSALVTLMILFNYACYQDVFNIWKRFQDDLTPEHVVPELIKGPPKWGYETASYGSFHDSHN